MGDKIQFDFTLFIQKHEDGSFTFKVVEIPYIVAYGISQNRCKDEIKSALVRVLSKMHPSEFNAIKKIPGGHLETVEVEFHPISKGGTRRKTKIKLKFSIIVAPHKDQFLVTIPILEPPMKFYVDNINNIEKVAQDELKSYFHDSTTEEILKYEGTEKEQLENISAQVRVRGPLTTVNEKEKVNREIITAVGKNLLGLVQEQDFTRAYEVDETVEEIFNLLASERRESILLVGPSLVGKTAIIYEVARRILKKQCPKILNNREIWMVSAHSIEAVPVWWENVMNSLVSVAREENIIIYFDDIIDLLEGVTSYVKGSEMAKFLKVPLANREIVIIGETTPERYERFLGKDFGFLSLFKTIKLNPPLEQKTYTILNKVRKDLEQIFDFRIEPSAADAAIEITSRFRPYWSFPGKAIHLLRHTAETNKAKEKSITKKHIFLEFSKQTGLPAEILSDEPPLDLTQVRAFFKSRIIGQDHAIDQIVDLISTIKAGINDPNKPLGTFIFLGPTGVGKTALAKALAEYLFGSSDRMVRLDMSEYSGSDALIKLIGIPGSSKKTGTLTRHITEQPFSLILLDEIEKADIAVFDMLLQVLGEGRLTDATGTLLDFRNAIFIMTSNLGASHKELTAPGFLKKNISVEQHFIDKLEEFFRAEFINRIDHIIVFEPLGEKQIRQIAEKELKEVLLRYGFVRRGITIDIDEQIGDLIAEKGFSPTYGARPLKRAIEKIVIAPIARYLATHKDDEIGLLSVVRVGDTVKVRSLKLENPDVKIVVSDPFVNKVGKVDYREFQIMISDFRRNLDTIQRSEKLIILRSELKKLLNNLKKPNFWLKNKEEIRETNQRIYDLDRVEQNIKQLFEEANFLEDLSDVVGRERDVCYLSELAERFRSLQRKKEFLEIELAYLHFPEANRALLLLSRLGGKYQQPGEVDWLKTVFNMYYNWIKQKDYTYTIYELQLPPKEKVEGKPEFKAIELDGANALKEYVKRSTNSLIYVFALRGPGVYGFLKGEIGLHRFRGKLPGETMDIDKFRFVKVDCLSIEASQSFSERLSEIISEAMERKNKDKCLWTQAFETIQKGTETITREYRQSESRTEIIDKKTGLRTADLKRVLSGDLDPFVIAFAKNNLLSLEVP